MLATDKRVQEAREVIENLNPKIREARMTERNAVACKQWAWATINVQIRLKLQERHDVARDVVLRGGR